ncbi:MAG: HNH endonuclease [Thiobacillaceae bacterium]
MAAYALVDAEDAWLADRPWHLSPDGYASGHDGRRTVYMHRLIAGASNGAVVDHINRNRLDNRRSNLRLTDWAGNGRNRTPGRFRYRGIRQIGSFWGVRIKHEGIRHILQGLETAEDAALAYDMAAIALFGVHAPTNFDYGEGLQGLDEAGQELLSKVAPDWLGGVDEAERSRQLLDEATGCLAEALGR